MENEHGYRTFQILCRTAERALEQGQADRGKAAASPETCLGKRNRDAADRTVEEIHRKSRKRYLPEHIIAEVGHPVMGDRFGSRMLNLPIKLPLHTLLKCHQFRCQEVNESTDANRALQVRMEQYP